MAVFSVGPASHGLGNGLMDATLRIKNLSIALEALSRFPGTGELSLAIETSLQEEIRKFRETQEKETQWPQRGPADPTTGGPKKWGPNADDDIPF